MDREFEGRAALITGASSGIGEATAHAFAREGAAVALAARREERLEAIAAALEDEYDAGTTILPTDVREENAVEAMVDGAADAFGRLDAVVANAGLARGGGIDSISTEEYRTTMETNVDGVFFTTRAAISHLRETEGVLVVLGSFAGQYPRPNNPVYAASKWWVRGFAHSVAADVGADGVGVSVINPAEVRTEFGASEGESLADHFEPGEAAEPDEIAEAILFAARQRRSTATEIDLYRRDKLTGFTEL